MAGTLFVVATPIGNLEDLSLRARRLLTEVDLVACEDTRRTGALLSRLGARRRLVALHEHNERARLPQLLAALEAGQTVTLVSDAGTPLLADPGYPLVREAIARGVPVVAVPGPSAPLAALIASGLPPYPFTFAGFPPHRGGKRRAFYRALSELPHTLVVFEAPHRLLASLDDAVAELGDRPAAIGRELTKLHEEWLRGPLAELRDALGQRRELLGEFVLVVGGRSKRRGERPRCGAPRQG